MPWQCMCRKRRAQGLALIILAHKNALAHGTEPQWIGALYQQALTGSDNPTRKDAEALLPELGGVTTRIVPVKPAEVVAMPTAEETLKPAAPPPDASLGTGAPTPAPIGLSVGFDGGTAPGRP